MLGFVLFVCLFYITSGLSSLKKAEGREDKEEFSSFLELLSTVKERGRCRSEVGNRGPEWSEGGRITAVAWESPWLGKKSREPVVMCVVHVCPARA